MPETLNMRYTRGFSLRSVCYKAEEIARTAFSAFASGRTRIASRRKPVAIAALLPVLVSCAGTLTADEQYERDDSLILAYEKFEQKRRRCHGIGGDIQIIGAIATRIKKTHTARDYKVAKCVRL